jgi:hypothetical protein
MGVVHEAYDHARREIVAIKTLRGLDPWKLYCLKNEFRALADIVHPNLVGMYELVYHSEEWRLVMERVHGVTFDRFVREDDAARPAGVGRRLPDTTVPSFGLESAPAVVASGVLARSTANEQRLRSALVQLVAGVHAIHCAGKLHRDLKPSNILVTEQGRVVLLDFGLVTDRDGKSSDPLRVAGTVEYLSPERMRAERATESSDWYAVGVILYEALTGVLPFEEESGPVQVQRARGVEPLPASSRCQQVPADLDALCVELLHGRPELRPSGADLMQRLGAHFPPSSASYRADAPYLVGREAELGRLEDALERAQQGGFVVLRLLGPSGIGKTAILDAFARRIASDERTLLLRSRCMAAEASPYKGLDGAVDALAAYLAVRGSAEVARLLPQDLEPLVSMFPVLASVPAIFERARGGEGPNTGRLRRRRAVRALCELLTRLTREHTVVLCIDDLQWGDEDGAELWAELAECGLSRFLFLGAARGKDEPGGPWDLLLRVASVEDVALSALEPSAAMVFAQKLLSDTQLEESAEQLASASLGHPIFMLQLAEYAREHARLRVSGSAFDFSRVVEQRYSQLSSAAREVVAALALLARPMPAEILRDACHLEGAIETAVRSLLAARWLREQVGSQGRAIELFHDRLREQVVSYLPAARQSELHGRIAHALSQHGSADAELLCHHFASAGLHARASQEAARAGAEALTALAFGRAAIMYERALALSPSSNRQRKELLEGSATALEALGRGHEAAEAWSEAASLTDDDLQALELRRRAAEQWLLSGRIERGLGLLTEAVALRLPRTRTRAAADIVSFRALNAALLVTRRKRPPAAKPNAREILLADAAFAASRALSVLDVIFGMSLQERFLWHALKSGDAERIAIALASEASYRGAEAGPRDALYLKLIGMAERLAAERSSAEGEAWCALARGISSVLDGGYAAGIDHLERAEALFTRRRHGAVWETTITRLFRAGALGWSGHWGQLDAALRDWLEDADARGDHYASNVLRLSQANGLRFLAREEPELLREDVQRALASWPEHPLVSEQRRNYAAVLLALADLAQGRARNANDRMEVLRALDEGPLSRPMPALQAEIDLTDALARLATRSVHAPEQARAIAKRIEKCGRGFGPALAWLVRGSAALLEEQPSMARAHLLRAEAAFRSAGMVGFAAIAAAARAVYTHEREAYEGAQAEFQTLLRQGVREPERFVRLWVCPWQLEALARPSRPQVGAELT